MCQRINDLRRERIRALATPQAAPFYQENSMKVVSMSAGGTVLPREFNESCLDVPYHGEAFLGCFSSDSALHE